MILHSEHMSVDEHVVVIGSSKMAIRSFQLDLESDADAAGEDTDESD